jgi:hypothetical protein
MKVLECVVFGFLEIALFHFYPSSGLEFDSNITTFRYKCAAKLLSWLRLNIAKLSICYIHAPSLESFENRNLRISRFWVCGIHCHYAAHVPHSITFYSRDKTILEPSASMPNSSICRHFYFWEYTIFSFICFRGGIFLKNYHTMPLEWGNLHNESRFLKMSFTTHKVEISKAVFWTFIQIFWSESQISQLWELQFLDR